AGQADVYITGDISHHEGIDAVACGMPVIDAGHYGIEHIFMGFMEHYLREKLGEEVTALQAAEEFPNCVV
ncbi:MAG: Nif3-like dinuclear metal center hexameric protein, partial [Clostridium sp.]|nr:Nif3-like dinuclear metal center hexameric protein [Clostridium sp.]